MVEVPVNTTVWTEDPASCVPPYGGRGRVPTRPSRESVASVAAVASGLGREAWQTLQVREGAKGPLAFEFAAVRVWAVRHGEAGPPIWLLVRRSLEPDARGQVLRQQRRRRDAAGGAGGGGLHPARGRGLLRGRQELPGDGAVRDAVVGRLAPSHEPGGDGSSVHHADAARPGKKTPELTLDRTVRLLQRAIEVPGLSLELALLLVDYHIRPQQGRPAVPRQDLVGSAQEGQTPSAVEVALDQKPGISLIRRDFPGLRGRNRADFPRFSRNWTYNRAYTLSRRMLISAKISTAETACFPGVSPLFQFSGPMLLGGLAACHGGPPHYLWLAMITTSGSSDGT